ncbi:hypothetical protein [Falsirhodobacter sp. 1013]|uniref:hypothetical protein n=1 Tax=Falsirhodobacter sp. 1013 TaxID=3417566 RepID=UPI003EBBA344
MNRIYHRIYLAAWGGWIMPRWVRKATPRTELHKAWLFGAGHWFEENGTRYGPANRYPWPGHDLPLED